MGIRQIIQSDVKKTQRKHTDLFKNNAERKRKLLVSIGYMFTVSKLDILTLVI